LFYDAAQTPFWLNGIAYTGEDDIVARMLIHLTAYPTQITPLGYLYFAKEGRFDMTNFFSDAARLASAWGLRMRHRLAVTLLTCAIVPTALAAGSPTPDCPPFLTTPDFMGTVPSPEAVLGFAIGAQEVTTAQSNEYLAAVDKASKRVITGTAATSVEGLPLRYAIVGGEGNVTAAGLNRIRNAIQQLIDPKTGEQAVKDLAASTPAILWVTGNVHGNEESGADAALRVLYELADRKDCVVDRILANAIVVVLPIQNPDGRFYKTRRNVYGFDLNRDWFARTQPETDGKLELLRQYPPVLYIDAHEFGSKTFFFPPNADPVYHEVPKIPFNWINKVYATAIGTEMDRQRIPFFHGAPYDLYAVEYGDSVPTIGFHAAGMTFEKYNGDTISTRAYEQFVAMWASLFAAATEKERILREWHLSYLGAQKQGADGELQPNATYFPFYSEDVFQQVPDLSVRHYFLLDQPGRSRELAQLVRRLQRMDVKVWRLKEETYVGDFRPYGSESNETWLPAGASLPAGTYWVPMDQRQKHWIQAMLHEDPYIPVSVSYDVTAWSNPLLMNISGGSSGEILAPKATLVSSVAAPTPLGPPGRGPTIGLFEVPGSSTAFESAGSIRYLFDRVWGVPYIKVSADDIKAGLPGIDVLLVPDGYVNYGLQALGSQGKKALAAWVEGGGRYVGYLGGTELAAKAGISTVVLQTSHSSAPGTLIRVKLDPASPLAAGVAPTLENASTSKKLPPPTVWVMYFNDDRMTPGLGMAAATFPAQSEPEFATSGLAIGVDELDGSAAIVDEPVGNGRAILFSFDPNFRAWTEGTQRILWNALYGVFPKPSAATAQPATVRVAARDRSDRAAQALPDVGKAIRIVVRPDDGDVTRALLLRYGAEFKELRKRERTIFLIENRQGLSWEEHPFVMDLARELRQQVNPISFSVR
jgi:hypothetical protein